MSIDWEAIVQCGRSLNEVRRMNDSDKERQGKVIPSRPSKLKWYSTYISEAGASIQ